MTRAGGDASVRRVGRSAGIGLGLLLLSRTELAAQPASPPGAPPRGDTVLSRPRPELEPLGLRVGSFLLRPQVGFSSQVDDNVYANNAERETDLAAVLSPLLVASTHGTRHFFRISAGADLGRYRELSAEDYDDWRISADALIDRTPASRIVLGGAFAQLHQPRESPDDAGGLTPVPYTSATAFADFSHRPGRVFVHPTVFVNRLEFHSVPALVAGEPVEIEQDDRNRNEYTATLESGFGHGPDDGPFLRLRGVVSDYDRPQQLTGFDRSSRGFEVGTGLVLHSGGVTRARVYAGYREQRYLDPLPDIREPVFGVLLTWNPSEITTLQLEAGRQLAETTAPFFSGYVATSTRFVVDHELRRSLLLTAALAYEHDAYVGIGRAGRTDKLYSIGGGLSWFLNRSLVVSLRYETSARDSTDDRVPEGIPADDFDRNVGWVRIELRR